MPRAQNLRHAILHPKTCCCRGNPIRKPGRPTPLALFARDVRFHQGSYPSYRFVELGIRGWFPVRRPTSIMHATPGREAGFGIMNMGELAPITTRNGGQGLRAFGARRPDAGSETEARTCKLASNHCRCGRWVVSGKKSPINSTRRNSSRSSSFHRRFSTSSAPIPALKEGFEIGARQFTVSQKGEWQLVSWQCFDECQARPTTLHRKFLRHADVSEPSHRVRVSIPHSNIRSHGVQRIMSGFLPVAS